MLIIGDLASIPHGNNIITELEIIYSTDGEKKQIIESLGIKQKYFYKNDSVEYYKKNKSIPYTIKLYDSRKCNLFRRILAFNRDEIGKIKRVDFITNFAFYKCKIRFRYNDHKKWEENLLKYLNYVPRYSSIPQESKNFFHRMYNGFIYYNVIQEDVIPIEYKYGKNNIYSDEALYYCFSIEPESVYKKIEKDILTSKYIVKNWIELKPNQRINAILEKLYVDTAQEYIIPYIDKEHKIPQDDLEMFKKSIMNLYTNSHYPEWFKNFIVFNYNRIIEKYSVDFLSTLQLLIKHDALESD